MVCGVCNKNQATVHLTEIVDGQMTELHLCEECARQKSTQMEQQFGLSDLLAGLAEFEKPPQEKENISVKCDNCGLTYSDFKKIGRLGCGECYVAFRKYLGPLLKRIHGSSLHFGKSPHKEEVRVKDKDAAADELKSKLQSAIKSEAFEEAARIRDEIKELERKQKKQNNVNKDANQSK